MSKKAVMRGVIKDDDDGGDGVKRKWGKIGAVKHGEAPCTRPGTPVYMFYRIKRETRRREREKESTG